LTAVEVAVARAAQDKPRLRFLAHHYLQLEDMEVQDYHQPLQDQLCFTQAVVVVMDMELLDRLQEGV
jgi:hypothetical protein